MIVGGSLPPLFAKLGDGNIRTLKLMAHNTDALLNEIKNYIIDRLQDYQGCNYYASDIANYLTESENANGSVYFSTHQTIELIKENFELFGEFLEYYKDNFDVMLNPFTEPEKTHVCFLICAVENILNTCKLINNNWTKK